MDRVEEVFNEKFNAFIDTFELLENLIDNKNYEDGHASRCLRINTTLDQLRIHESNLATIASLPSEPAASDLNNRINTLTTNQANTVAKAKATLLDLETKLARAKDLPDTDEEVELAITAPLSTLFTPVQLREPTPKTTSLLKTPKLAIPTFKGDYKTFPTFWRQFQALIHDDSNLSLQQKSIFLAEALQGPAKVHLENKSLNGSTYHRIITTLQTTYQPKLKIDYRIYDELTKLPISQNEPHSVRCRVNEIRALLDQLDTDQLYQSEDPAWVKVITTKFPTDIINTLCWRTSRATSIRQLLINLEKTADSLESFSIYTSQNLTKPSLTLGRPTPLTPNRSPPLAAPRSERPCVFCDQQGHRSAKCPSIITPQQRRDIIKQKNRCWICFSPTHTSVKCTFDKCRTCGKNHHSSLCSPPLPIAGTIKPSRGVHCATTKSNTSPRSSTLLMTSRVSVLNPVTSEFVTLTAFLDPGATQSFITESVAKTCQLEALDSQTITATGFSGNSESFETLTVNAIIRTPYGTDLTLTMLTSPKPLTGLLKSCSLSWRDKEFLEKSKIVITNQLIDGQTFTPDILLGMDWCASVIDNEAAITLPSGLKLQHTQVGPCIYGKSKAVMDDTIHINSLIVNPQLPEETMVKQLFEIDNLGISPHDGALNKSELFFNDYANLIEFQDSRIRAPLPLKRNASNIQSNKRMALATLNRLQRSLLSDAAQMELYHHTIHTYIRDGVVEVVPSSGPAPTMLYYMPHRGVWKSQSKKPLRVVFNASAKQKGQLSLNDITHTGESFNNKIVDILTRIRTRKYFLMCDIQAAFTQIHIAEDHKDLCRFLWLKDPTKGPTPHNILELRFNRLAFGITASPAILNMCLYAFLKTQRSKIGEVTLQNLYVDNIFYTTNAHEELESLYKESKQILAHISMNVREYFSCSTLFNSNIPQEDKHPDQNPKILGVSYHLEDDVFLINFNMRSQPLFTKRDLLSSLHSIYDPLGLAAPLLLPFKLLLRQAMTSNIDWKEQVPADIVRSWNEASNKLKAARIQVPRLVPELDKGGELWIFADASISAIASCAYYINSRNTPSPLLLGKTKLAPKNRLLTIPRLEMAALLMGMKIAETLYANFERKELPINITSDSQIALSWLFTKKSVPVFISNLRQSIEEIARRIETQGANIRFLYVDTSRNPADLGTRGTSDLQQLKEQWLFSPQWLTTVDDRPVKDYTASWDYDEPAMLITPVTVNKTVAETLFHPEKFSSYWKLQRIASLVLHAAILFLKKIKRIPTSSILAITAAEHSTGVIGTKAAELLLIKEAQLHLTTGYKKQFRLITDQHGLLIINTRLTNSSLPQTAKNPYLLPKKSPLGTTILTFLHNTNAHIGITHLLSLFLQNFYMTSARQVCKSIIKRCVPCQKMISRPFSTEYYAPLPEDRVTKAMPFRHTGMDCIGPIKHRRNEQVYIVIFTCLTIRAVHLEPITDMSSVTFFNAFIRFVARRGLPHLLRSDNGSNFTHSEKILRLMQEYNPEHKTSFTNYVKDHKITWIFNTPSAPWTGGVWERLVAITKTALYKSLSLKLVNRDQLNTAIIKIEGIINSRPITYTDSENFQENPLTPADFLSQGSPVLIPGRDVERLGEALDQPGAIESNRDAFENLQKIEIIAESFWKAWAKNYLLSLRHAHASKKKSGSNIRHPYPNEIVLVEDDSINRSNWNMARILELLPSSDHICRTARITLGNGKELKRPIENLYPLELYDDFNTDPEQRQDAVNTVTVKTGKSWNHRTFAHLFRFLMIICLITSSAAELLIACSSSQLTFRSLPEPSTICIEDRCHELQANNTEIYNLATTVFSKTTTANRSYEEAHQTLTCPHPHPCDFPPPFLLHAVGNPHCNPTLTTLIILTPIVLIILMLTCIVVVVRKTYRKSRASRNRIRYIPSLLFLVLALSQSTTACEEHHTRKNTELVCDDINNCTTLISHEIPFNPLHTNFCSHIKFQNTTIGKFEIRIISHAFECSKTTLGFTRLTNLTTYTSQRCAGTEHCPLGRGCDNIQLNTFIQELAHSYQNPGQTYCTRAGGGLLNNCGLPVEGCILFRPTYQPETDDIYKEIRCIQWKQNILAEVSVEYLNNTRKYELKLQPYRKYVVHGISIQVSSVTNQVPPLFSDKLFLVSEQNDYMVLETKQPAIICRNAQIAEYQFHKCTIRKPCACLGAAAQLSCTCEAATTRELQANRIPKTYPTHKIIKESGKITVKSYTEETTITMETTEFSIESLYSNDKPCFSDFQKAKGCYQCTEGVELNITCATELFAILTCDSFSTPLFCADRNPTSTIKLYYEQPEVTENCILTCGRAQGQEIKLSARLHYIAQVPSIAGNRILNNNETSGISWNMPKMGPLWEMIWNNWRWILPIGAAIGISSYGLATIIPIAAPCLVPVCTSYFCLKTTNRTPPAPVSGNP